MWQTLFFKWIMSNVYVTKYEINYNICIIINILFAMTDIHWETSYWMITIKNETMLHSNPYLCLISFTSQLCNARYFLIDLANTKTIKEQGLSLPSSIRATGKFLITTECQRKYDKVCKNLIVLPQNCSRVDEINYRLNSRKMLDVLYQVHERKTILQT